MLKSENFIRAEAVAAEIVISEVTGELVYYEH